MGLLTKLNQVPIWAPLSFKVHAPIHFDSYIKASLPISRGVELFEIESWISGHKMNQIEQLKSSIINGIFEYISAINPEAPYLLDRLRIAYQLSSILRDKSSLLHDFAESFPSNPTHFPIYWKDSESTSCLPLRQMIADEFFLYRNSYDKIFDLDKQVLSNISFEEMICLDSIVKNKGVVIGKNLQLVPIVDRFPHSFEENTEIFREGNVVRVFSKKDLEEGTILTRNYGIGNNYWFLMNHGFIPALNPYHKVPLSPEILPNWKEIAEKMGLTSKLVLEKFENPEKYSMSSLKRELLNKFTVGGLGDCAFSQQTPDTELEKVFRIFFLNETDMSDLKIKSYSDLFSHNFSSPISLRNQKNTEIILFKLSEMTQELLNIGFQGKHTLGQEIESIDKSIVAKHFSYYSSRMNN
jgi:hypothetical protein